MAALLWLLSLHFIGERPDQVARQLADLIANSWTMDGSTHETALTWEEAGVLVFRETHTAANKERMTETRRVACSDLVSLRSYREADHHYLILTYRSGAKSRDAFTFETAEQGLKGAKAFRLGPYTPMRVEQIHKRFNQLTALCRQDKPEAPQ